MRIGPKKFYSAALVFVLAFVLQPGWTSAQTAPAPATVAPTVSVVRAEKFFRTELYLGRSIPGGGMVSDPEWNSFLAETVTPRFPDGFTSLKAIGQYREKGGQIVTEPSEVLIFFYSGRNKNESRAKIEQIRAAYVKRFKQESVLRVDLPKTVRVSF